jgi:hypothetical protein
MYAIVLTAGLAPVVVRLPEGLGDGLGLPPVSLGVGVGLAGGGVEVGVGVGVLIGVGVWLGATDGPQLGGGLVLIVGAGEASEG